MQGWAAPPVPLAGAVDCASRHRYNPGMSTKTLTYADGIRLLAQWHGEDQDPPVTIFSYDDPEGMVVRLLEVSEGFPVSGEAWPIAFGASQDLPFRSEVIIVAPEDLAEIEAGRIAMPASWGGQRRRVWPE